MSFPPNLPYTDDMDKTHVTVWTDGAASGNPGPAGWATLINGAVDCGWLLHATNNQMELYAAYQAILHCPMNCVLEIVTDSKLLIGLMTWGWQAKKEDLANMCRMMHDTAQLKGVTLRFTKTKGHAYSDANNDRVDKAARAMTRIAKGVLAASLT